MAGQEGTPAGVIASIGGLIPPRRNRSQTTRDQASSPHPSPPEEEREFSPRGFTPSLRFEEARWLPQTSEGSGRLSVDFRAPAADTPEEKAEEKRAATVHAERVAEFVCHAGVVLRIDRHVATDEQIGHGHWHQRPLHDPSTETGGVRTPLHRLPNAIERPSDGGRQQQIEDQSGHRPPPTERRSRCNFVLAH